MSNIKITVKNKIATNPESTEYICGNSDFVIDFDFDAEWDAYETKTARFIYGGGYQDIIFQGSQCAVPVISNTNTILCGVYAGDLHTTTPALIRARKGILCGNSAPADPPPDVYAQMMEILNKLSSDNPVDAVRYIPQELTEEQQKQARENIQAATIPTVSHWCNGGEDDILSVVQEVSEKEVYDIIVTEPLSSAQLKRIGARAGFVEPPFRVFAGWQEMGSWMDTHIGFVAISMNGSYLQDTAIFCGAIGGSGDWWFTDVQRLSICKVNGTRPEPDGSVTTLRIVNCESEGSGYYIYFYGSGGHREHTGNEVFLNEVNEGKTILIKQDETYFPLIYKSDNALVFGALQTKETGATILKTITLKKGGSNKATVTETELPTVGAIEALKTEMETGIDTLKTDIGNNFLLYTSDQSLTMEQKINAASNMGVRIPLQIFLSGDGSEENPFDTAVLFEGEQVGGLEAFGEVVGGWLSGAYDVELLWVKGDTDILSLSPAHLCGDETGGGILFSNAQWQVTFTATQNEDGNTDWTVTAKETVPSGEEHWLTQTTEITEPVSAIKIPLPSPDIRKAVMRVALFSETEGTKISVRIYADRETSSGAKNMLAAIGNYYTNAQSICEAYVSWSACGQKALNIYQTTASSVNYEGAAAMYYIDRPQEYLYLVDTTPDTTFTGTITLDYCV